MYAVVLVLGTGALILWTYVVILKRRLKLYVKAEETTWRRLQSNIISKQILVEWMEKKKQGIEIADFLQKNGSRRIAIYGMDEVGEFLYRELKEAGFSDIVGIDQERVSRDIYLIVKPEDVPKNVDVVIVAVVYYFSEIYDVLRPKLEEHTKILGLDEILYEHTL